MNDDRDSYADRGERARAKKEREKPRAKITCQFRDKGGMVYELDCLGTNLAITILETENAGEPWRLGAALREEGAPAELAAHGKNRTDALDRVVEAWSHAGYTSVDWEAIRLALATVRAV